MQTNSIATLSNTVQSGAHSELRPDAGRTLPPAPPPCAHEVSASHSLRLSHRPSEGKFVSYIACKHIIQTVVPWLWTHQSRCLVASDTHSRKQMHPRRLLGRNWCLWYWITSVRPVILVHPGAVLVVQHRYSVPDGASTDWRRPRPCS